MGCSILKVLNTCFIILAVLNVTSILYYNISSVSEGKLKTFIYGKDFKNKPCGLMDGKQQFQINLPYKPSAHWTDAQYMSFCVPRCPGYIGNTTRLLIEGGYGHLFEFHRNEISKFLCGTLPGSISSYSLQGGRCKKVGEFYIPQLTYYYKVSCCLLKNVLLEKPIY